MLSVNAYLSAYEVLALREKLFIIDVRDGVASLGETDDLARQLPNATAISGRQLQDGTADLPTDKPILVYCQFGMVRSVFAAAQLKQQGYEAYFLQDGFNGWSRDGFPTTPRA